MTPEKIKELLPVITAYATGETIQWQKDSGIWADSQYLSFTNDPHRYRIKPKPVEMWANVFRDSITGKEFVSESFTTEAQAKADLKRSHLIGTVRTIKLTEVAE